MLRSKLVVTFAAVPALVLFAACSDQQSPTSVKSPANPSVALSRGDQGDDDQGEDRSAAIIAHDDCDPASFDAALNDPNACVKHGHTTFTQFVAEVTANKSARKWRFTPDELKGKFGVDINAKNNGGEVHTFTPVKQFAGGLIPFLNDLTGNPVAAPECLSLEPDDMVASGAKYTIEAEELADVVDDSGIARVQCCIHPWMKAEIRLKEKKPGNG